MDKHGTSPKSGDDSIKNVSQKSAKMIDVGQKEVTRRIARAEGKIRMSRETFDAVVAHKVPKGNVFAISEVAGLTAAKKTSELLPLCHPIALDKVSVKVTPVGASVSQSGGQWGELRAECEVICHAKTGVEMEALTGVSAALLCAYDMIKVLDPVLEIREISLLEKLGGKSGHYIKGGATETKGPEVKESSRPQSIFSGVRVSVLTVSDRCSKGEAEDKTGPAILDFFKERGAQICEHLCLPDEKNKIATWVEHQSREHKVDVIVTTGGTGLSPRDVSPEAIEPMFDRVLLGFGERLRELGTRHKLHALLSRSTAGQIDKTLVFVLPGSTGAVSDALHLLGEILEHALHTQRGGNHL